VIASIIAAVVHGLLYAAMTLGLGAWLL